MPNEPGRETTPTLADKINLAFETLHPVHRGPFTNREVARWFLDHGEPGEPSVSVNYLAMLRSGERDNPTIKHLRALARFFGVPATYFIENTAHSSAVHTDLQLVAAMRDADVRAITARAMELDPAHREWLRQAIMGLPSEPQSSTRRRRKFQAPDPESDHPPPDRDDPDEEP